MDVSRVPGSIFAFFSSDDFDGTGRGFCLAGSQEGLFRTVDGAHWESVTVVGLPVDAPERYGVYGFVQLETRSQSIIAGAQGAVLRSNGPGQHWEVVPVSRPQPAITALATLRTAPTEYILAASMDDGVFQSDDDGATWLAWNLGLLDPHVLALATCLSPDKRLVYAGTETGVFLSRNAGKSWHDVDLPFGHDAVGCLAALDYGTLLVGSEHHGLWVSRNNRETWKKVNVPGADAPINGLVVKVSGKRQIVCFSQGPRIFVSTDDLLSWKPLVFDCHAEHTVSALALFGRTNTLDVLVGMTDGRVVRLQLA
jgi:photosystem II stability/assembly factor-like uncharacterized protein